jgi:hypothetical protein
MTKRKQKSLLRCNRQLNTTICFFLVFSFLDLRAFGQEGSDVSSDGASLETPVIEQDGTPATDISTSDLPNQVAAVPTQVARRIAKSVSLVGNYGVYSFIIPGKKGAQLTWLKSASSSWELEYFSGDYGLNKYNINLISFGERVIVGRYRKYWSNSFNLGVGLGERRYSFELGSQLTENIPGEISGKETLIELKRYIFDFSLGNRWHFDKGFVLNIDWFEIGLPFGPESKKAAIVERISNSEDKKNTKKVLGYLNYLPTLTFLKLGIGFAL